MSEIPPEEAASPSAPAAARPSRSERFMSYMWLAQTVTAVMAVIISCAALYATWVQARTLRVQTEALVWPRLISFTRPSTGESGEPLFDIVMANRGVGPAEVQSMRVRHDGQVVRTYAELFALAPDAAGLGQARYGFLNGRILAAGEEAVLVSVEGQDAFEALTGLMAKAEVDLCYCSILGQCWALDEAGSEAIRQCPDYGEDAFLN